MPEHFTFEQALRNTSKIHFHKGVFGSLTVDMNGLGYQFLTCSAFPCNEDRGIGLCYAGNRIQHIHQSLATPDEIERQTILQALDRYKGNLSQVATALGISRAALYRRLEKYNITM